MSKKYDVFISYRRDGGIDSAVALQSTLRQMHYRVFLDVDSLRTGRFDDALLKTIGECRDFLLVLSPHALERCMNEDDWVRREIEHAMSLGKNIIPIICDGGSVQERLNVPLPESLASLPSYNVLETNVVQLQAMTQLLRTSLQSRPHNPVRSIALGAAVAAVVCVISFFGVGMLQTYLSTYPRTAAEKNLVEQAIIQQSGNLSHYNVAMGAYLKALDDSSLYLSGSPMLSRSEMGLTFAYALDAVEDAAASLKEADPAVLDGLIDSPLSVADLAGQAGYVRMLLDEMYSVILFLDNHFLDDPYTTAVSKSLWVECYRELAALNADTAVLGVNEMFLPVSEAAAASLRTVSLPLMTSIYTGQSWVTTEADAKAREENLFKRQQAVMDKLNSDLLKGEAMLENERRLEAIREEVSLNQRLADVRRQVEEERKALAAAKARLYELQRPTEADDADILFGKGLMFLSFDMMDATLEAFALYGHSDAPNARQVADAASHFAIYRELTGIRSGVIVSFYEEGKVPQPEICIGDIIYAVNGVEVAYVDEYIAAKNGRADSEVQLLRFTDAGYERLTVRLDPTAGLMGMMALAYQ